MTAEETRKRFVATGARLRSPSLLEQADASIKAAKDDAGALGARFPEAKRSELESLAARVRELFSDQSVAKADVPQAGAASDEAFRAAKDLVGDCIAAASNAFEDEDPEVLEAFRAGNKIGQSVAKLDAKIAKLVPLATTHAAALAAWGEPDMAARLTAGQTILRDGNAAQEKALTDLPRKTADLYEAKGRIFGLIKKLNRAAGRAFKGQQEKRRAYNLDIVYRPGGKKATKADAPAPS